MQEYTAENPSEVTSSVNTDADSVAAVETKFKRNTGARSKLKLGKT